MAEYHSSAGAFEKFLRGNIWRDMKYELGVWLDNIHLEMENPGDDRHAFKLAGNAETVRNVLAMPETVMQNIIDDSQEPED